MFGITLPDTLKDEALEYSNLFGYPVSPDAISGQPNRRGQGDVRDAFRHIYGSAVAAYELGKSTASGIGELGEMFGDNPDFLADMDRHNNQIGIEIGQNIHNRFSETPNLSEKQIKDAIASEADAAISSGKAVFYTTRDNDADYILAGGVSNFIANDAPSRTGSIDTGSLIRAISGGRSRMSSKQIFAMSAAAFAQELIKSRRRSLENDLLDILTGGNGKNTLAQAGSGNPMSSLPNVFGGLIDNLVGSAMSRRKTRTSTAESARSIEASRNWNPSRSQQQAMLASWTQQGGRNL